MHCRALNRCGVIRAVVVLLAALVAVAASVSCEEENIEVSVLCGDFLVSKGEGEVALFWRETNLILMEERGNVFDNPPITPVDFNANAYLAEDLPRELLTRSFYECVPSLAEHDKESFVAAAPLRIVDQILFGAMIVTSFTCWSSGDHPLTTRIDSAEIYDFHADKRPYLTPVQLQPVSKDEHPVWNAFRVVPNEAWQDFGTKYRYLLIPADPIVLGRSGVELELELLPSYLIIDYEHLEQPDEESWLDS